MNGIDFLHVDKYQRKYKMEVAIVDRSRQHLPGYEEICVKFLPEF